MKKVIIVESNRNLAKILKRKIAISIPQVSDVLEITDSFDYAIHLINKFKKESEKESRKLDDVLVITSDTFDDKNSPHRNLVIKITPDMLKYGDELARRIKGINPNAQVFVFSQKTPEKMIHLDGYIPWKETFEKSIKNFLETIQEWVVSKKMESCLN